MPTVIRITSKLHDSVARATLAGGAAAVVALFIPATLGLALAVLAIGCAIAPPASIGVGRRGDLGGRRWPAPASGSAVSPVSSSRRRRWPDLARGVTGTTRWSAAGLGALGAVTAGMIARAFAMTEVLAFLPSGIAALVTGATTGLVWASCSIGRHVTHSTPPLEGELGNMRDETELGQLLGRAAVAYREAVAAIGDEAPAARAAADDMVRKMTRFGRRWRELEAEASRSLPAQLHDRLQLVGRKLEATQIR